MKQKDLEKIVQDSLAKELKVTCHFYKKHPTLGFGTLTLSINRPDDNPMILTIELKKSMVILREPYIIDYLKRYGLNINKGLTQKVAEKVMKEYKFKVDKTYGTFYKEINLAKLDQADINHLGGYIVKFAKGAQKIAYTVLPNLYK